MKPIKEITIFSNGDSDKISTWSNVPFFFTQTLISKNIKVNRIDLSPSPVLLKIYNKTIYRLIRKIFKNTTYDYFRSYIHFLDIRRRIKLAISKYPNADVNIFLTFSFASINLSSSPSVLFGDWTYDHYFKYFEKRQPDFLERSSIKREDTMIEGVTLVFPLFPSVAEYMKNHYKNKNIHYLGNVINSIYEPSEEVILEKKSKSHALLFIGNKKYHEGAVVLISAFKLLKIEFPDLTLNIIGMIDSDFTELPADVQCYGYLDKAKESDRLLYYSLLENAKICINTTPKWGAFSASLEAMYFYIPIIVAPYTEFITTFGKDISFGTYCEDNEPDKLKYLIRKILVCQTYKELCLNAHNSVKEFTWGSYIDKILAYIGKVSD